MGTISKALNLLNYFSVSRPEIGLSEFRKLCKQDKATIYRHLTELEANGFVEQDPVSKFYRMGPAVLRLANVRERTFPARKAVAPIVADMSTRIGELVHVSLLQGDVLSPLYYADVKIHGTRVYFDEAEVLPLHATSSGYTMLAFADESLAQRYLAKPLRRFTDRTLTDPASLQSAIDDTKRTGFGECDQGFEDEVYSMAVPVFGRNTRPIGTIAVALPTSRVTPKFLEDIKAALMEGCRLVSKALGGDVAPELERIWNEAS
jgi:DNA-binding IclR family transcriptional regulator